MADLINEFIDAIKPKESTQKPHVYNATVSRIEDGVVYVQLTGAETDTPTALSASEVKRGDAVTVEWRNNRLYIAGNTTDPAAGAARVAAVENDARRAQIAASSAVESAATASEAAAQAVSDAATAQSAAETAQNSLKSVVQGATTVEKAVSVMQTALEAVVDYDPQNDTTKEYFWHDANGAHVLGTSGAYRNDITSNGMQIVSTATEKSVAEFSTNGIDLSMPAGSTANSVNYMSVKKGTTATVSRTSATVIVTAGASDEIVLSAGINKNGVAYSYNPSTMDIYVNGTKQTGSFQQFKGDAMVVLSNVGGGGSDFRVFFTQEGSYTYSGTSITLNYAPSEGLLTVTNGSSDTYTCYVEYKYTETHAKYRMGTQLVAEYDAQTVLGKYNDNGDNALEVGNGADGNNRSNALTVDWSGNVESAGDITDGSGNVLSNKADASDLEELIQSKVFLANYTFKNTTANAWQYTGKSFTVPTGYVAICYVLTTYSSGACKGLGLCVTSTLPAAGTPEMHQDTNSSHMNKTCAFYVPAGTYYVFSKRAAVSSSNNTYNVQGIQIKL